MTRREFITLLGGPKWETIRQADETEHLQSEESPRLKTVAMSSLAIALGVAAWLLPMRGEQATARSVPHILVVEYDIVPAEIDKYLTAIKELGAAAVKEPGYRQLSIAVSQKDPNHLLLFEAWDKRRSVRCLFNHRSLQKIPGDSWKYDRQARHTDLLVGRDELQSELRSASRPRRRSTSNGRRCCSPAPTR